MGEQENSFLYPDLKNYQEEINNYTLEDLKKKLSGLRIKDFENDLYFINDKIKHYRKFYKRWNRIDEGIKLSQIIIGTCVGIAGIIFITPVGITLGVIGIPIITGIGSTIPITGTLNSV